MKKRVLFGVTIASFVLLITMILGRSMADRSVKITKGDTSIELESKHIIKPETTQAPPSILSSILDFLKEILSLVTGVVSLIFLIKEHKMKKTRAG